MAGPIRTTVQFADVGTDGLAVSSLRSPIAHRMKFSKTGPATPDTTALWARIVSAAAKQTSGALGVALPGTHAEVEHSVMPLMATYATGSGERPTPLIPATCFGDVKLDHGRMGLAGPKGSQRLPATEYRLLV